ncbi:hypothetical protein EYF80_054018 [Liparis tanakae]|uniref:Uncharacterized protein n=1 Tax=Liparis tanakae TaxID=230148 RepID=A0A4Z2F4Z3_9TELE|nr:hypothetical protein EYF80_054018 [Liparis tanakae]
MLCDVKKLQSAEQGCSGGPWSLRRVPPKGQAVLFGAGEEVDRGSSCSPSRGSLSEDERRGDAMLRLWSLRRGSSFTFLTPGPQWDFGLANLWKRPRRAFPGRSVRSLRLHRVRGLEGLVSVAGRERESGFQPPVPSRSGSNRAGVRWNATVTDGESGPGLFVSPRQQVEAARDVSGPSDEQHSSFSRHDA